MWNDSRNVWNYTCERFFRRPRPISGGLMHGRSFRVFTRFYPWFCTLVVNAFGRESSRFRPFCFSGTGFS